MARSWAVSEIVEECEIDIEIDTAALQEALLQLTAHSLADASNQAARYNISRPGLGQITCRK